MRFRILAERVHRGDITGFGLASFEEGAKASNYRAMNIPYQTNTLNGGSVRKSPELGGVGFRKLDCRALAGFLGRTDSLFGRFGYYLSGFYIAVCAV